MNIAILLSGGVGHRMGTGNIPKQYLCYEGRRIINYSLKTLDNHSEINAIIIVAAEDWRKDITNWMMEEDITKFRTYAAPGENRQLSILHALWAAKDFAKPNDVVLIHDAARPLVSESLIHRCLALGNHDGVMPVLPVKDTTYMIDAHGAVNKILPRSQLAAGQAPEAFRFGVYLGINETIPYEEILNINGSTEIALRYGLDIVSVPGEERNFKITTRDDLALMALYLHEEAVKEH